MPRIHFPSRRTRSARSRAAGARGATRGAVLAALALVAVVVGVGAFVRVSQPTDAPETRARPSTGFEDTAKQAGITFRTTFLDGEQGDKFRINLYDHGSGVAVGDYDGDGRDDIYFCNQLGPNALYRNLGGGKFQDVTKAAGPIDLANRISVSAVFADYDNDGHLDLFVTTTRGGNALFHNLGDGTFEDATAKAGLTLVAHSQGATFFDADGDGLLDLLVTNTARWTTDEYDAATKHYVGPENLLEMVRLTDGTREPNRFYHNLGGGKFADETAASGLAGVGWSGDTAVFDYDEDGDLDLLVGNMFGSDLLFQNDGKGHFHDVAGQVLGKTSYGTMGAKAFDYDGDGKLDLFVVDMHSDMWQWPSLEATKEPERLKYRGPWGPHFVGSRAQEDAALVALAQESGRPMHVVFGNTLFQNLGGGRFQETSDAAGAETFWPWGIATGDFDGDGFEDAFIPSGMGYPFVYWRSPLLMNNGDGTFTDRAKEAGLDPMPGGNFLPTDIHGKKASRSSRSAATADFDGDGKLDLVVNNFNDGPLLLMNRWPARHWVEFHLTGTKCNRDAIGALVRIRLGRRTLVRQVQAAGGYLAQSSNVVHFGLGDATTIDRCEIHWPCGTVQVLENLPVDRRHEFREATD